jgi:hypothetical protein
MREEARCAAALARKVRHRVLPSLLRAQIALAALAELRAGSEAAKGFCSG